MGLSEMALTGCVSEPLFSMLFGLGCSMLRAAAANHGSVHFSVQRHAQAILPLAGICLCLGVHGVFFIFNCRNKFNLKRFPAFILLFIYAFFFGIIIALTAILPENHRKK
jgi:Ca2+/Na+ antiporter